ncbi:UDP-N-acetylmuramoyl-L-alanyl-D-glutamate--2,6-diaminopimelate ligase [Blattabacterium cuenoti]|uniref:UDP-N-acetylmuramoyl-L-alanyl-D-glutamate--2, 6-diaminopimelate ligase n=1 Tax=Blattabacterium cuenoti TaxID=1653831 RepID=UPI001EEB499B|nr:UDP-N-acetylmuramoyl-L-alanyl-D-glutamate--2,6-diaminopimelate ligase [Blattabacterium cuenoti]
MRKYLENILKNVNFLKKIGCTRKYIEGISINSETINKKNIMFVAIKGKRTDGHLFILNAIKNGATCIVCEKLPFFNQYRKKVAFILVKNTMESLGVISSNFYNHPTKKIKLVGITGTNGKTSIATMLYHLFCKIGEKSTLISTMGVKILTKTIPTKNTTPNIVDINKYLDFSIKKGCKYAFMEVSSHGIHQKRIEGLSFTGGVFTNITHDHLDYHKSFNNYLSIKRSFFEKFLPINSFSLINSDDPYSHQIIKNTLSKTYFYGLNKKSHYKIKILKKNFIKNKLLINKHEIYTSLIGKFNVSNLLAVYSTALLLGKNKKEIIHNIKNIQPIKGRFEQFLSRSGIRIIVDYAHNPDGIKNLLNTIKEIKEKKEKLICVIGCGGNRDKKKRPIIGKIVYEICDISIFTSDNPREENPEKILIDMNQFVSSIQKKKKII